MVTGQSMVLWSRLHLICHSHWKLRGILVMIVTNAIVFHGSQTVCSLLVSNKKDLARHLSQSPV